MLRPPCPLHGTRHYAGSRNDNDCRGYQRINAEMATPTARAARAAEARARAEHHLERAARIAAHGGDPTYRRDEAAKEYALAYAEEN